MKSLVFGILSLLVLVAGENAWSWDVCFRSDFVVKALEFKLGRHCADITPEDMQTVTDLNINASHGDVRVLRFGDLSGLSSLKNFSMQWVPLQSIDPEAFEELTSLQTISINNTGLKKVPPGLFEKLYRLWKIDLSDNAELKAIDAGEFNSFASLGVIDPETGYATPKSLLLMKTGLNQKTLRTIRTQVKTLGREITYCYSTWAEPAKCTQVR